MKENDVLIDLKMVVGGVEGADGDGDETGEDIGNGCSGSLDHSLLYVGEIFHNTNLKYMLYN